MAFSLDSSYKNFTPPKKIIQLNIPLILACLSTHKIPTIHDIKLIFDFFIYLVAGFLFDADFFV